MPSPLGEEGIKFYPICVYFHQRFLFLTNDLSEAKQQKITSLVFNRWKMHLWSADSMDI